MKGVCLLGETSGFPIVTDPKGAEVVLNSLTRMLGVKVDMSKLDQKVKEMEQFIKKVEDLQKRALTEIAKDQPQAQQQKTREQTRYIG
jgi:proteasome assembly chaperone (PAC2) family protein